MGFGCELDGCGISCEFGCACMSYPGGCDCWCENVTLPALARPRGMDHVDAEMYVSFTASGMPLTRLAELFDFLFPGQIMIPAANARNKITMQQAIRDIKLGELVEHLGLVPTRKPLTGRSFVTGG
jgi:hypothetical protein